jgi:hypothetical protein
MPSTAPSSSPAIAPASGFDLIARAVAVVSLTDLALVHVIDLPGTLDETPLIGAGFFMLIAAALVTGVLLMVRPNRMAWAASGLVAAGTMGAYILTRTVSGFLGDHDDLGNWRCSLGLAALSLETVLIALAAAQVTRRPAPVPVPAQASEPLPVSPNSHRTYTNVR